ncbi:MAG: hypothetical protein DDT22_00249 [candidate division WS2 bacterium]|nr:hypothetical protein [Bacillota bacterium]MBT9174589.1 hypothetical protein [Candidatus Lithacetigena glycinireducens]
MDKRFIKPSEKTYGFNCRINRMPLDFSVFTYYTAGNVSSAIIKKYIEAQSKK